MPLLAKRFIILLIIAVIAFVLGRLAVRGVLNLLLGGTLFGAVYAIKRNSSDEEGNYDEKSAENSVDYSFSADAVDCWWNLFGASIVEKRIG